jgi:hypothetical protein
LRAAGTVVLLDAAGEEIARVDAPAARAGVAITDSGDVVVSGEASNEIARYRVVRDGDRAVGLERTTSFAISGAVMITDIATGPADTVYAIEEHGGRMYAVSGGKQTEIGACHGPIHTIREQRYLAVDCLNDHTIEVRTLDGAGKPHGEPVRIRHDGPLWAMSARVQDGKLLIAVGGVEDRPLARDDGGFGYVDSFAFVYEVGAQARRLAAINVSELGVITPKWLELHASETDGVSLTVAGYASDRLATLRWAAGNLTRAPQVQTRAFVPGTTSSARTRRARIAANPLLDAWIFDDGERVRSIPLERAPRSPESLVGERRFFTTLMATWNSSEGKRSRFTCETCHYEGYIDGRTHYTGRDTVSATTKPLLGLFNNRPHFTRALDRTMTKMVHNEFRVANKFNGHDPWFDLAAAEFPWLSDVEGLPETLTAVFLRRSLMTFFMEFSHRPNPAVRGRAQLSELERDGARVFRDRCERCHAARLVTDDPSTRIPFEEWETAVLSSVGPIVWASSSYQKTGVTPYVHDKGARTTSLRRLYKKYPYFTNGSAKSLADVLATYASQGEEAFHAAAPPSATRLTDQEQQALLAFLQLL